MATYVKSTIAANIRDISNDCCDFELMWIKIKSSFGPIIILYHPPKPIYHTTNFYDFIKSTLEDLIKDNTKAMILLSGHFNQLNINEVSQRTGLTLLLTCPVTSLT